MLRTLLAVGSMGAAIAIFSCSGGNLGGNGNDAGPNDCPRVVPASCYRACNGSYLPPNGGSCPAGYVYIASYCAYGAVDGSGPVIDTCGDDGGADGVGECVGGTMIAASCYRTCDGASTTVDGGTCPAGFNYIPSACVYGSIDGRGPVPNTCGADAAAGTGGVGGHATGGVGGAASVDAGCTGRFIPEYCVHLCTGASYAPPDGGVCPNGDLHVSSVCLPAGSFSDGWGPTPSACGDGAAGAGGTSSSTAGRGGNGTGGSGTGGSGGACTTLANDAPTSPVHFHSGDRTAADLGAGGVIVDGIYDLNSSDIYRSSDSTPATTAVATIRISNGGTRMEYVSGGIGDAGVNTIEVAFVRTLATSGTQVTETEICRANDAVQAETVEDYTATSTRLMLSNPLYVKRFVKR
jgi:hypothetical protein